MQSTKARHQQRRERDRKSMKMSPRTLSDSRRGMTAANGTTGQRELGHGTAGQRDNGENGRTGQRDNGKRATGQRGQRDNGPCRRHKPTKQGNGHRNGPTGQGDNGLRVNGFTGQRGAADSPANGNEHKATCRATKQQHYVTKPERGIQSTSSNKITKSRKEDDRDKRQQS